VVLHLAIKAALKRLAGLLANEGLPDQELKKSMDDFRRIALETVEATELTPVTQDALQILAGSLENEELSADMNPMEEIRSEVIKAVKTARKRPRR
jgi:hypothetical protein